MKKFTLYLGILLTALTLASCRSAKNATSNLAKEEITAAKNRFEAVTARNFDYDFLQSKVKYDFGGKSLSGRLNIEHSKRICFTITVMGIEVARVEANPETVYIVNKVNKVYAKVAFSEAAARLGLQEEAKLETLEALLLGRIYLPGKGLATKGDFNQFVWYPMSNEELQADYIAEKYQLSYVMDGTNYLVATQVKVPAKQSTFVWEYADPTTVSSGSVPTRQTLSVSGDRHLSFDFSLSSPSTNPKNWNSFQPSEKYREVTFLELIDSIKNMNK